MSAPYNCGSINSLYQTNEFSRVWEMDVPDSLRLRIIAEMCRLNTIAAVKRAGSGHLGSSFSSMDLLVWLYFKILRGNVGEMSDPNSDVFFSSKGHDVPAQYSVLAARGLLSTEKLLMLRRLGGLDGHPDVRIPGIMANTGSLGMGISKGCGVAWSMKNRRGAGNAIVLVGDGEFQEGQNYEALQWASHNRQGNLFVIMDHNKLQTDKFVSDIVDLGDFAEKIRQFGWAVERCDGHSFDDMNLAFIRLSSRGNIPKFLIADTIKGAGVKFMEHPEVMRQGEAAYRWHSGAPDDSSFLRAVGDLTERIQRLWAAELKGAVPQRQVTVENEIRPDVASSGSDGMQSVREFVIDGFESAVLECAKKSSDFVVLDADLSGDCRIRKFENQFPDQFIECGIAEQHMVSMAGALARQGKLPIVNSFSSFLVSRANEQIYNNSCERSKVIYACHFSGFIPAGPGKSHQSIRDISLLAAMPYMTVVQPASAAEAGVLLNYLVENENGPCAIRMNIGPSPKAIMLPEKYVVQKGRGHVLQGGQSIFLMSYGPVMLNESLVAAEMIRSSGIGSPCVINMPWLSHIDTQWLTDVLGETEILYVIEDHCVRGGLGDRIARVIGENRDTIKCRLKIVGIEDSPECGTPQEVLKFHGMDGRSLAERILSDIGASTSKGSSVLTSEIREANDECFAPQ